MDWGRDTRTPAERYEKQGTFVNANVGQHPSPVANLGVGSRRIQCASNDSTGATGCLTLARIIHESASAVHNVYVRKGYLAQNAAQISRHALASGLPDDSRDRAPSVLRLMNNPG